MDKPPAAPPPSAPPSAPSISSLLSVLRTSIPSTVPVPPAAGSKLLQAILPLEPSAAVVPPIPNIHVKKEAEENSAEAAPEEKKDVEMKEETPSKKRKGKPREPKEPKEPKVKVKSSKKDTEATGKKKKVVTVKRLLLNDAVAHSESMEGWSEARKQAFKMIDTNPNAYYYRFNAPGEMQRNGGFSKEERELFLKLYREWHEKHPDGQIQWGIFSKDMPGRVGYQCTNFYRKLLAEGALADQNYYVDAQGVLRHKSYAQHHATKGELQPAGVRFRSLDPSELAEKGSSTPRPKRKRKPREESPAPDDFEDSEEEAEPVLSDDDEEFGRSKPEPVGDDSGDEVLVSPTKDKSRKRSKDKSKLRAALKEKKRIEALLPAGVVLGTDLEALYRVPSLCRECGASDTCHRTCLSIDVKLTEETRFLWRCPDCKVCDSCHNGQDEEKMLVCDVCDRGFHIFCLSPPLAAVPEGRWLCSHCVQCKSCGTRTSEQWLVDFTYCGRCGDLYLRNNFCPACEKCYEDDDNASKMIQCDACAHWVHAACDGIDDGTYQVMTESTIEVQYKCPKCRARFAKTDVTPPPLVSAVPPPLPLEPALPHWNENYGCPVTAILSRDKRRCVFCGQDGDQFSRLVPTKTDQWAHAHCIMWSPEVDVDERNGTLRNFSAAHTSAKASVCVVCDQPGASLTCAHEQCHSPLHFPCARGSEALFLENRQVFCKSHTSFRTPNVPPLTSFALPEKVCLPRLKPKVKVLSKKSNEQTAWRSGALTVLSLGAISALDGFHTRDYFFPIGFRSMRWGWSTQQIGQRTLYEFTITSEQARPRFTLIDIAAPEKCSWSGTSAVTVWKQMCTALNAMRRAAGDKQSISGLAQQPAPCYVGIAQPWVEAQLEELEHAKDCVLYHFKHNAALIKKTAVEEVSPEQTHLNSTGCARSEGLVLKDLRARKAPKAGTAKPGKFTGGAHSASAPIAARSGSLLLDTADMPVGTRYRQMKGRVKHLRVARSHIHDLGVYSRVPLKAGDIIVEYVGELIRPVVADKREKLYDSRGIGCYMFRLDEKMIVDATMRGNIARYVNHSCGPNAYSDVIEVSNQKKIVIIAKKDISPEEEITYDYQFEFEDNKIPCGCGAPNCRKFIN